MTFGNETEIFYGDFSIQPSSTQNGYLLVNDTIYCDTFAGKTAPASINLASVNINGKVLSAVGGGSVSFSSPVAITDVTDASSSIAGGALTVSGGLAVAKSTYLNTLSVTNAAVATN